jgi:hypothetical protein
MSLKTLSVMVVIFILGLFRLLEWIPNVSPVAAMALFAGAHLNDRKLAFVIPLAALLLSDLLLGFHATMIYVYASFTIIVGIGLWLRQRRTLFNVTAAALVSSLLFFLITNMGVWLSSDLYPAGAEGLLQSYIAAIPFYRNTLIGDLLFTGLLFGGYSMLAGKVAPRLVNR